MKSRERGYPFVFVNQEAGYDTVKFENPGLASGRYLYRQHAGSFVNVKRYFQPG